MIWSTEKLGPFTAHVYQAGPIQLLVGLHDELPEAEPDPLQPHWGASFYANGIDTPLWRSPGPPSTLDAAREEVTVAAQIWLTSALGGLLHG